MTMRENPYTDAYFLRGEGSNYHGYENEEKYEKRAASIVDRFDPQGSVLEIGCAKGYVVKALQEAGIDAHGIDMSDWVIKHGVADNLRRGDVTDGLPYEDGAFELVISYDTLEHIPEKQLPYLIEEMRRVAKKQFHLITTSEHHVGGDATHCTIQGLDWWKEQFSGDDVVLETLRDE